MSERFDVIVLGAGPGGEVVVYRLAPKGVRVALVERELIGGECAYWACVPSKSLLRPPVIRGEALRGAGTGAVSLDWVKVAAYRDYMVRNYDDGKQMEEYARMGVTVVKGVGRLAGPGAVTVADRRLEASHVVVATGSKPTIPAIEGLREAGFWTNREATALKTVPASIVVVGGGPVGIELGQMLAAYGSRVTLVQDAATVLDREGPEVGAALKDALVAAGIDVRTVVRVQAAHRVGDAKVLELDDGSVLEAAELLIATGRHPNTHDLCLETVGLEGQDSLATDDFGRVKGGPDGLWAVGDVTGAALFTHVAKYQGRTVAANILHSLKGEGAPRRLDYRAVPRVVFSDPEVAAVGLTEAEARRTGIEVRGATVDMASVTRSYTYARQPQGVLRLLAQDRSGVVVGAWAYGPLASEWIHIASLAVAARLTVGFLRDAIYQFPTFSEAYLRAAEELTA